MDRRVASSDRKWVTHPPLTADDLTAVEPAGIWHGYAAPATRTLCGRPLLEMHAWPALAWPETAPDGAACFACSLVAESAG